jgi:leucyl/phenylalanyl-tRNA--protein transferase
MTSRLITPRAGPGPAFPDPCQMQATCDGLIALGGDLSPRTLIEAYQKGLFPWEDIDPVPWFSPDPRCILEPKNVHVSRSLRRVIRSERYRVTFDRCFGSVMRSCADTPRSGQNGTWIGERMIQAFTALHRVGVAHSVEVWSGDTLAGGLYGLALGGAFFGESMFARETDASKVGLCALASHLDAWGFHFIDCQKSTAHLVSLGAIDISRADYLQRLEQALSADVAWHPGRRPRGH